MIFKNARDITNSNEKKYFIEKIDIIISIIQELKIDKELKKIKKPTNNIIVELIKMGSINNVEDIGELEKIIGRKRYISLISAINYKLSNEDIYKDILDKFYNSYRKQVQASKKNSNMNLVDLFCGAGGLSLGFIEEGFTVKLANDIEDVCIETYRYNHPELPDKYLIHDDIKLIIDNIDMYIKDEIDVVVGGPPCQGFSSANQQRIIDDPRNNLYKYFIKAVELIAPKFIVMENVRGMLSVADQVIEDFNRIKTKQGFQYIADYQLLNSYDFSVAQSRERLFYIAIRSDVKENKDISPSEIFNNIKNVNNRTYVLKDSLEYIRPLEAERVPNRTEVYNNITGKKVDKNEYKPSKGSYINLINQWELKKVIFNHKARYCNDINYEIYKRLDQGNDATDPKIADIMPYAHRNHVFKDKYFKLIEDRPSRTITAHLRMDCHSHIHPNQIRAITPREAARIQSFPDDYLFLGPYLKTYMQIGNAVPPLMARGIAKEIKKYL